MRAMNIDDVACIVEDWKNVWEPKILAHGERESQSSKSMQTKLAGGYVMLLTSCVCPDVGSGVLCVVSFGSVRQWGVLCWQCPGIVC